LIYFIVIGQFLGASRGIPYFAIFVFTGLTAWGFFLEAVTGGTGSIVANSGLVKKVYLPREIFPLSTLGTSAVNSAIQLVILLAAIVVTGQIPSLASLAYLPLALVVLVVYATLFGLLLSALNVYMRDIQHLIEVITFLAFWASPIVYSYSYVQRALATNYPVLHEVYLSNPVTLAILGFQRSLWAAGVDQPYPAHLMIRLAGAALIGIVLVFGAHRIFARLEGNFAQEL
jgi:ABC-2 type transporter